MNLEVLNNLAKNTSKTPVLFIHGAWHAAWCWQDTFMPCFAAKGHPTYAVSLRGHGNSAGHLRWASVHDYVADVDEAVQEIQSAHSTKAFLVGHSMGGYVVQKYLEKHEAPAAVLLASIPTRGSIPFFLRYIRKHPLQFLKAALSGTPYHFINTPQLAKAWFLSDDYPPDKLETFFPKLQNESYRVVFDSALLSLPRPRKINTPLLVLGAENDRIFPPHEIRATAKAYGVEAELFPNMAHNMMIEQGWEGVADRILNWLDEQSESI